MTSNSILFPYREKVRSRCDVRTGKKRRCGSSCQDDICLSVECCDRTLDQPAVIDFSAPEDNISVYPNPFTDKLNIYVKAKADDVVEVAVYDVMGRKVMQWAKETLKSDFYHITWDGITNSDACAPGIYLVRITLNGETVVRKVEKQ